MFSTFFPSDMFSHSGSMMPAFKRGDILFLTNYNDPIRVGEIVVFKIKDRDIPIVHRVLQVHEKENGEVSPLTLTRISTIYLN